VTGVGAAALVLGSEEVSGQVPSVGGAAVI
jgi:hypothetical protein